MKKVSFHTLGCKLNFSETSTLSRRFSESDFEVVPFGQPADVVVINTCSVTGQADHKGRQSIRKAIKESPGAFVAVVGCFAQLKGAEIADIPGVGLVLGTREKFNLPSYIHNYFAGQGIGTIHSGDIAQVERFDASYSLHDRTRSFLKVQDGCDYHCSYCTIPLARGRSRNAPVAELVEQARLIVAGGIREIVLSGVNVGDFGKSTDESFVELMDALEQVPQLQRVRISSIEPNLLSDEVISRVAASSVFAPHFHIPLQSGSDRILGLMRRRYDRALFARRVEKARSLMPGCCIGVDVIVGFPGETEADFDDAFAFLSGLDISYLHVFAYSERPNTPAIDFPGKVAPAVRSERSRCLLALSEQKRSAFYRQMLGQTARVLWEQREPGGLMTGFTEQYVKVVAPFQKEFLGTLSWVRLEEITERGEVSVVFSGGSNPDGLLLPK